MKKTSLLKEISITTTNNTFAPKWDRIPTYSDYVDIDTLSLNPGIYEVRSIGNEPKIIVIEELTKEELIQLYLESSNKL